MSAAATVRIVYTVIVADHDAIARDPHREGREIRVAPEIVCSCGHEHNTLAAAEACRERLWDRRCGKCGQRETPGRRCRDGHGHSIVSSAKWHSATIHPHPPGSMDYIAAEAASTISEG